tara:strand:- start:180 stop:410 length:231 start_codon:yes stop_codon:yes gene_type:complete
MKKYTATAEHPVTRSKYNGTFVFTVHQDHRTKFYSATSMIHGCSADLYETPEDAIDSLINGQNSKRISDIKIVEDV